MSDPKRLPQTISSFATDIEVAPSFRFDDGGSTRAGFSTSSPTLFDSNGRAVGRLRPDGTPEIYNQTTQAVAQVLDQQAYSVMITHLLQGIKLQASDRLDARDQMNRAIQLDYLGMPLGGFFSWIERLKSDHKFRQASREVRQAMIDVIQTLQTGAVNQVAMASAYTQETVHRGLTEGFEEQDYQKNRARAEREGTFASDLAMQPIRLANGHAIDLQRLQNEHAVTLAGMDAQQRTADRDAELVRDALQAGNHLYGELAQIRLMYAKEPSERMGSLLRAMEVIAADHSAFTRLSPARQAQLGPDLAKEIIRILHDAANVASAGGK